MEFQNTLDKIEELFSGYLPQLLSALAVFVVGWLVALGASKLAQAAVRKLKIDKTITTSMLGKGQVNSMNVEIWVGRLVYYTLMLIVLGAFFQTVGLNIINEPINKFLETMFGYAPRLIGPVVLLSAAWVVASVLKHLILRVASKTKFDERIDAQIDPEDKKSALPISSTFAETVYWLVFLLFLPAVLDSLALKGLIEPINSMVDKLLGFLPNIFGALLIFAAGWFIAKIVQRVASSLLQSLGINKLSSKTGVQSVLGEQKLSDVVGTVIYVLIIIPVLIASLNALKLDAITAPASEMLNTMLQTIPSLFAACLVLFVSFVVGKIVAELVTSFLSGVGFDNILVKLGLSGVVATDKSSPSKLAGTISLIALMLFAGVEALSLIGFESLASVLNQLIIFAGQVVFGILILGLGMFIANLVAKTIASSSAQQAPLLSSIARIAILVLTFAMGLKQMGIADEIISIAFSLTLGAIAIAAGLAFGLGGKDTASKLVADFVSKFKR